MTSSYSSGLEQLRALQAQLNELIDSFPTTSKFHSLDTVGEPNTTNPQDPRLEQLSAKLIEMQALVQGDRLPFQRAFEVRSLSLRLSRALADSRIEKFHIPSSLRVAIEAHIEESLREAGKPLSAEELAKPTGIDSSKLGKSPD